jgi:dihydroxyacetone kinase
MGEQIDQRKMEDRDVLLALIGAMLLQELNSSRTLRRKISGTNLEKKLKNIIKYDQQRTTTAS